MRNRQISGYQVILGDQAGSDQVSRGQRAHPVDKLFGQQAQVDDQIQAGDFLEGQRAAVVEFLEIQGRRSGKYIRGRDQASIDQVREVG